MFARAGAAPRRPPRRRYETGVKLSIIPTTHGYLLLVLVDGPPAAVFLAVSVFSRKLTRHAPDCGWPVSRFVAIARRETKPRGDGGCLASQQPEWAAPWRQWSADSSAREQLPGCGPTREPLRRDRFAVLVPRRSLRSGS